MAELLLGVSGIKCEACGARSAQAPHEPTPFQVCANCWNRFSSSFSGNKDSLEIEFNAWLARQVVLQAQRLEKRGVIGRCEARSMAHGWPNTGYQCAHGAVAKRDGRLVCSIHDERAIEITFIDEDVAHDPYADFGNTLLRVAKADTRLAGVLSAVVEELRAA